MTHWPFLSISHLGADTVRFKAEVNFDGREVARAHVNRLHLENLLKVMCATITTFTRRNTFFFWMSVVHN